MDNTKKQIVEALSECFGIVTDACRKTNTPRSTYYKWLKDDAEFKKAVDETQEEAIDFVESELFKNIKGGDTTAQIFYLKTKGKKRGYIERQEIAAEVTENKRPSWFSQEVIMTTNGVEKES